MKYIAKFNEINSENLISNDRITEIIKDLTLISAEIDKDLNKCNTITEEISSYTTKSVKSNNQIDDAYVNFKSLSSKLSEVVNTISLINEKLEDYTKNGEKFLD